MNVKNIVLTGGEVAVTISGSNCAIRNDGAATIYASDKPGIVAGADGVVSIPAGAAVVVQGVCGAVYLLGTGEATCVGTDYATCPFKTVSSGGGADIVSNAAESVTLDGLQGGVPFSEIVLSGDDIINQPVTLSACGKNLISYPYKDTTKTLNGITFTDNGDGTINIDGTATSPTVFYLLQKIILPKGVYTLSGCPAGGASGSYKVQFATGDWKTVFSDYGNGATKQLDSPITLTQCRIAIESGTRLNNLVFRPQLENGSAATEYEQYHGSLITVTPDKSPYTVPNDIRQQDGLNNVFASAGNVSVTGVRRNTALKKIWDKLDELTAAIIVTNGVI